LGRTRQDRCQGIPGGEQGYQPFHFISSLLKLGLFHAGPQTIR
jgi:hypothetical protein